MMRSISFQGAAAVWLRQAMVWRQLMWPSLATNVFNPLLFLAAFGFGLGAVVPTMGEVSYIAFVVPGMIGYTTTFVASFETTISAYSRFSIQRTWDAILATPVTLTELLLGETFWAATKALVAAFTVLLVGALWGGILSPLGAILTLPLVLLGGLGFAAQGLFATSIARNFDVFSYFFTFWLTPQFVFSGVFFELSRFPLPIQVVVWLFPAPHLLALLRPLTTGMPLGGMAFLHILYLVLLAVVPFLLAERNLRRRMFD